MEMGEVDIVVGKFVSIRIFDGVEIKKKSRFHPCTNEARVFGLHFSN